MATAPNAPMKTFEASFSIAGDFQYTIFKAKSKAEALRMIKSLGARSIRIDQKK